MLRLIVGLTYAALAALLSLTTIANGYDEAPKLDGTRWIFEANSLIDVWVEPVGDALLTLEFHDGHFNGFAGCNSFFGPYTQRGNKVSFDQVNSSLKICEEDIQRQEDVVLEALGKVSSFVINEVLLHMDTGEGTSLVYRRDLREDRIIDHGGLHTFETCEGAGGILNTDKTECRIDGGIYHKNEH